MSLSRFHNISLRSVLLAGLLLLASGCATIKSDWQAQPSQAFKPSVETRLGKAFAKLEAQHQGESGFRLINNGVSALMTRGAMADIAEHAIDVQTYIFEADESGCFVMERLWTAANRGTRVRILVDDYVRGMSDRVLQYLDGHPNIEVRVFNPYPGRADWTRGMQMLLDMEHLGRRMHNKMFLVDGQIGILGGRNLGNHYFEAQSESNFRDVDVFASGPVVRQAGNNYDRYWNSNIVVPVAAFPPETPLHSLTEACPAPSSKAGPQIEYVLRAEEFRRRINGTEPLVWARATTVAEAPQRAAVTKSLAPSSIALLHARARRDLKQEMLVGVAYFVPGQQGTKFLNDMVARGIKVRVLTNSLASTDVVAVHSGYSRYREALLRGGVELHEYLADSARPVPAHHRMRVGTSNSTLHAKVVIYDRKHLWIGSANFDPRSAAINTETGVMIESEELARRVAESFERDLSPKQSWKLALRHDQASGTDKLTWTAERAGHLVTLDHEPDASLWRHLEAGFYSLIPGLEELL